MAKLLVRHRGDPADHWAHLDRARLVPAISSRSPARVRMPRSRSRRRA
jgi:hypothetical protein